MKAISSSKLVVAGIVAALCLACVAAFATMSVNNATALNSQEKESIDFSADGFNVRVTSDDPSVVKEFKYMSFVKTSTPSDIPVQADETAVALKLSLPLQNVEKIQTLINVTISRDNAKEVAGQVCTFYVPVSANGQDYVYDVYAEPFNADGYATFKNVDVTALTSSNLVFTFVTKVIPASEENLSAKSPKTGLF